MDETPNSNANHDFSALEQFEADEADLVSALRNSASHAPRPDLRERVMAEIAARTLLGKASEAEEFSDNERNLFFGQAVMARINSRSEERLVTRKLRRLSWLSHSGVAVASVLLALLLLPFFDFFDDESAKPESGAAIAQADEPVPEVLAPLAADDAGLSFGARVRELRSVDGVEAVVLDAGLVEGVTKGDVFFVNLGVEALRLEVLGVSPWYCYAALPSGARNKIKRGDNAQPAQVTELMRESARAIAAKRPPQGAFFGLGVRVTQGAKGLLIKEVIADIWQPDQPGLNPSRASLMGLRVGDRIVAVFDRAVSDEASFADGLGQITVRDFGLVLTVERGSDKMVLRERAGRTFPPTGD